MHIEFKHQMKVKPHNCKLCQKSFIERGALSVHLNVHFGIKNYKCTTCGTKFSSKPNLRDHERRHL